MKRENCTLNNPNNILKKSNASAVKHKRTAYCKIETDRTLKLFYCVNKCHYKSSRVVVLTNMETN